MLHPLACWPYGIELRAIVLETPGDRLVLRDEERPVPEPANGEALVRVEAAGFCHHDALIMAGVLLRGVRLPLVLGHEFAGVVEAVGPDTPPELVGLHVTALPGAFGHRADGAFAEYVVVPVSSLVSLPDGVAPDVGALLACPAGVALKAVEDIGIVAVGETVVVSGVSGGLGSSVAQIAHALGARVIGVTTSADKLTSLEAHAWLDAVVVDEGSVPLAEVVLALTDDVGADVFIDTVGANVGAAVASLTRGGRLVLLGHTGEDIGDFPVAEILFREAHIIGSLSVERQHVEHAIALLSAGHLVPQVDREFSLSASSVGQAYGLLRTRAVTGRIVLTP
jgi:acryloyl-coenzyme A reductase